MHGKGFCFWNDELACMRSAEESTDWNIVNANVYIICLSQMICGIFVYIDNPYKFVYIQNKSFGIILSLDIFHLLNENVEKKGKGFGN